MSEELTPARLMQQLDKMMRLEAEQEAKDMLAAAEELYKAFNVLWELARQAWAELDLVSPNADITDNLFEGLGEARKVLDKYTVKPDQE